MKSDTSKPVSSHIARAFADLEEQINGLQREIACLEDKLTPVIRPTDAVEETEAVAEATPGADVNVPLANQVRLLAGQIRALRARVTDVVTRIEL